LRKCKGKFPIGLLHDSQKRRIDRRRELMKLYDKATSPAERGRLFSEVQKIDREEKKWNASL
jgi:hypothetical protein